MFEGSYPMHCWALQPGCVTFCRQGSFAVLKMSSGQVNVPGDLLRKAFGASVVRLARPLTVKVAVYKDGYKIDGEYVAQHCAQMIKHTPANLPDTLLNTCRLL